MGAASCDDGCHMFPTGVWFPYTRRIKWVLPVWLILYTFGWSLGIRIGSVSHRLYIDVI